MDSFEINKTLMAIILALLIALLAGIVAERLVAPKPLEKQAYIVEGVESDDDAAGAGGDEKAEPITPLLAKASMENGQKVAQKCLQCHTFEKGGANKVGPNLWDIVGNKSAHVSGFSYSSAMQQKNITWDFEALNEYLFKPRASVPGTKMSFVGLKKTQERADLIAYMRTLSDSPKALPGGS